MGHLRHWADPSLALVERLTPEQVATHPSRLATFLVGRHALACVTVPRLLVAEARRRPWASGAGGWPAGSGILLPPG